MSEETAVVISEGEQVNSKTGELVASEEFKGYAGVATLSLDDKQRASFDEIFPTEAHDILPTGEVYVSQVHYRRKLNQVFGPGGWALVPRGPYVKQGATLIREYALVVNGRFVSEATGEGDYHETNSRMSYASTAEAVKSNALTRCCKDLGIGWECWDKRFGEKFKREHCVKVWRKSQRQPQWRRKDAEPWYDEKGSRSAEQPALGQEPKPEREPGSDDGPPSGTQTCRFCDSLSVDVSKDGKTAQCTDCGKGWPLGR